MNVSLPIAPICFGNPERRLFGVYHAPQASDRALRPAVILCNAFGQEAIRAHRFQRMLAERLTGAGHAVLRFDYYGTCDSMGDDADVDLDGWSQDILTAHKELQRRSGATRIVWAGMRLGATAALRTAHNAPTNLASLVLWEPVLDGVRYLAYLRERHIASLESEYSLPLNPAPRECARDPRCYRDEAIGFALPPCFRKQLEAICIETHVWPTTPGDIIIIADPATADGKDLKLTCARDSGRVRTIDMQHDTNWTTDAAGNSALVPAAPLMTMAQQVGESA
jgi:pimeloyl-ACP methyl ester carboxylesterase